MEKRWMYNPKPAKLDKEDKQTLVARTNKLIHEYERLKQIVNRIDIKAGRIYLYHLVEQYRWNDPDMVFIKPLIDGRYMEYPLARITLFDKNGFKCTADWQRHTGQWFSIHEGNLQDCLKFIDNEKHYFM